MFRRHEPWKDLQAAANDLVVVEAGAELLAAVLGDDDPAARRAVVGVLLFQPDDRVGNALDLQVLVDGGQVVEQQDGTHPAREELLECQYLAPVAQRRAGHEPQFGQRIEHHPGRPQLLDIGQDAQGGLAELDLGGVEHRVLLVRFQRVLRGAAFRAPQCR